MKSNNGGGLPDGWELKRLGDVCDVIGGGTPSKDNDSYYDGNILWATVRDMKSEVIAETEHSITEEAVKKSSTNIIPAGNVIIATRVGLGKVCLLKYDTAINQDLKALIPINTNKLSKEYLFSWLKSIASIIVSEGTGATVQGVKLPFVKSLPIPIPPLPVQRRIVAILDEAFAAIAAAKANAERNLTNARELFEAKLQIGGYDAVPMGSLVNISTGKLDANAAVEKGRFPFFTCAREIYSIDRYSFDCEAILLAGNNAVGDFNVKHYQGKFDAYQRTYVITVKHDKRVIYRYLYYQITKALQELKTKSVGAGTKFLKIGILNEMMVSCPPLPDQHRIVAELDALSAQTKQLESIYQQKIVCLNELKQALLQKAFNGELTNLV
ncbi:MAG: restriction endonuclease subunit S [Bacillota bacterium]